jgi:hypothetical protein
MFFTNVAIWKQHLEVAVSRKKTRGKEILLRVEPVRLFRHVVLREMNVVDMYKHSFGKPREYLEKKDCNIGIHKATMGAIQKENVSRFQFIQDAQIAIFQGLTDHLIAYDIDFRSRMRIDRDDLSSQTMVGDGLSNYLCREPGTNFNVHRGILRSNESVESKRIKSAEPWIQPRWAFGCIGLTQRNFD